MVTKNSSGKYAPPKAVAQVERLIPFQSYKPKMTQAKRLAVVSSGKSQGRSKPTSVPKSRW